MITLSRRPKRAPQPRRRSAAGVGWWGLSLIAASLGVVVLIGTVTFERVGQREAALHTLTVGLQHPTELLLAQELRQEPDGARVTATADLVAFDLDRAVAMADPGTAARAAAEDRAVELYDKGFPPDPGPGRTELGISRSLAAVMSEHNHDAVAATRTAAAILALALLTWCFIQAADDNMLLLPASALVGGWLLATAASKLVVEVLSDVNGASDTYVRSFEAAAAQPLAIAKTAAIGLLAGAVLYRFAAIARQALARRSGRQLAATRPA